VHQGNFISYGIPEKEMQNGWIKTEAIRQPSQVCIQIAGSERSGVSNDYNKETMPPVLTG
jgi:hypothetical protein